MEDNTEKNGTGTFGEDVKLTKLVQDRIQWCAFVLAELNLQVVLPGS
jgi:hypothetical protein